TGPDSGPSWPGCWPAAARPAPASSRRALERMDSHRLTPQKKDDFAPGKAPAPHRRAKSCSVWSSGQAGRGAKLDSASRQTEHSPQYNGSGWLRNPYFVYVMTKRRGEGSMTLLPDPLAVPICAPMRLSAMLVVDGLATASCTLHDQPMPVKPPRRAKRAAAGTAPSA